MARRDAKAFQAETFLVFCLLHFDRTAVAQPGHYLVVAGNATAPAQAAPCPLDTFSDADNTADSCQPCPAGLTTLAPGSSTAALCGEHAGAMAVFPCMLLPTHVVVVVCAGFCMHAAVVPQRPPTLLPSAAAFPGPSAAQLHLVNFTVQGSPAKFLKSYADNGVAYLWPYINREWPAAHITGLSPVGSVADGDNYCVMLGGHLPSIHTPAQADHLSGVYRALWPWCALTINPFVLVGMPTPALPSQYELNLWSDYTALDYPGAGGHYNGGSKGGLDTSTTGQLVLHAWYQSVPVLAACAGG